MMIVVTHGTDTLEKQLFHDAYLNTKPVVITGSMRNYDEIGYDGFSLFSSILVAQLMNLIAWCFSLLKR